MKIVVGRVADFEPGDHRVVDVGRRSIGVFRIGDRFYALNNRCPHQGGPLCLGRTAPWVHARTPGEIDLDPEPALVACPWHGWEYEIATGRSFLGPSEPPARGYGTTLEPGAAIAEHAGRTPGPYVAETFEVHVDDDYVVVDTTTRPVPAAPERITR